MKRAVVLLSGGLDSTTTLAIAKHEGYEIFALSFEYGQRHRIEIDSAKQIGQSLGVREHRIAKIDLRVFGSSALTDAIDVPKYRSDAEIAGQIPVTYVPARNTIFLSYALAWAETIEARDIFIGANAHGAHYSGTTAPPSFRTTPKRIQRCSMKPPAVLFRNDSPSQMIASRSHFRGRPCGSFSRLRPPPWRWRP